MLASSSKGVSTVVSKELEQVLTMVLGKLLSGSSDGKVA